MEQELNVLIDKFQVYSGDIKGSNEFEIFSNFYKSTASIIDPWVEEKFNKTTIKCVKKSQKLREDGNIHFKAGSNYPAILSYTKSIIYAPFDSLEFNLSLGNRSAALFHVGKYEACIQDLDLCLNHLKYPEQKKFKLHQRMIQSYIDLKQPKKAQKSHDKLMEYLTGNTDVKLMQIAENLRELIELIHEKPLIKVDFLPTYEHNLKFSNASRLVSLKFDSKIGRHVTAASDIKSGDVLFVEKTKCFVPIKQPEETSQSIKNLCYYCFAETFAPIPCNNCDELFCSLRCLNESWTSYHSFECVGSCSEIWKNIGVNYLAFRVFLHGFKTKFNLSVDRTNIELFAPNFDECWYERVCSLVSNVDKMAARELLPHLVSSLIMLSYLEKKTDFIAQLRVKYNELSVKSDVEICQIIGSVLLKHILQVICNASIIEGVTDEFYKKFDSDFDIKESGMYVQGTGLFPSVSLMNHSCDSNVTNYFLKDTIIVKANRAIEKGEEICNCYGHDCRSESTKDRKSSLKFQYYFDCECSACLDPSRPEMYENGLNCPKCNNCALNTINGAQCLICCYEFNINEQKKTLETSDKLYKKWQMSNNVKYLEQCYQMEQKIYHKYNYKLYDLIQDLQNHYKNKGYPDWWTYTELILDLDKKIYGCCSLKYGLNIRHTLIVLLQHLSRNFLAKTEKLRLLATVKQMLRESEDIFCLYYPKHKLKYEFIISCIKKVQIKICNT